MNQRRIIEAAEACRSGSDDLQNAEMSELAEALQQDAAIRERCERIAQWDRVVGDAIRSGSVPEGLCNRLLDAVSLGDPAPAGDSNEFLTQLPTNPLEPAEEASAMPAGASDRSHRRTGFQRRWWIATALVTTALVLTAAMLLPFGSPTPQLTAEFASEVIVWTQAVPRDSWSTDFTATELRGLPFDGSVQAVPRRWATIETRYSPRTVVYELAVPRQTSAYLFCFASGGSSLPPNPPNAPFSTTGGFSIGAWQRGDLIYVLAVQGGERRYRGLIQSSVILGRWQASDTNPATLSS